MAIATAVVFSLVLELPGSNTFDKPVYFAYFPLAVIGAWTLVDWIDRRARTAWVAIVLVIAPVNVLPLAAAWTMRTPVETTARERTAAAWVRASTPRDAVFVDAPDRVFLLNLGPRRYLFGRTAYARQWGYDRVEMSRRYHARAVLYSSGQIDGTTLEVLGEVSHPLYVIAGDGSGERASIAARYPEYFQPVFSRDGISIYRVDRTACAAGARTGRYPFVTTDALLAESGL
jgi:hypothetical protein